MHGSSSGAAGAAYFYPRVGQAVLPQSRGVSGPQFDPSPAPPSSSGLGIKVMLKPEYLITPPPQLIPQISEVPHSTFQFNFEFEKTILAETEKERLNLGRISADKHSSQSTASSSYLAEDSTWDPVVDKYVSSGLGRESVTLAVLNYGDNPVKVREFVRGYNLLREMGFQSKNVGEALAMYDNDTDKALAYLINS